MRRIACLIVVFCSITQPLISFAQVRQLTLDSTIKKLGDRFITDKQAVGLSIGVYTDTVRTSIISVLYKKTIYFAIAKYSL
jgi:hypothetical protein